MGTKVLLGLAFTVLLAGCNVQEEQREHPEIADVGFSRVAIIEEIKLFLTTHRDYIESEMIPFIQVNGRIVSIRIDLDEIALTFSEEELNKRDQSHAFFNSIDDLEHSEWRELDKFVEVVRFMDDNNLGALFSIDGRTAIQFREHSNAREDVCLAQGKYTPDNLELSWNELVTAYSDTSSHDWIYVLDSTWRVQTNL